MGKPKVAIVHDYLWTVGGAEKVVEALAVTFPEAPIYTSFLLAEKMKKEGFGVDLKKVKTTWMQFLPFKRQLYKFYFLLYPLAFRSLNLKGYDVVITSSSYAAIHTTVKEGINVCYCHTPSRYLYGYDTELDHAKIKRYLPFMGWLYSVVRKWDQDSARRVDYFVTNSKETQGRIQKHYQRSAEVIYPPVDIKKFAELKPTTGNYFFTYGRLVAHKRTDIIVEAFNELGWPLKVAGSGLEFEKLKKMAKSNVEILGRVDDEKLKKLIAGCKAVIFAAEEDFGIVPVEAQAARKPVVAYFAGGVLESVVPKVSGVFFKHQTPQSLKEALEDFNPKEFDPDMIGQNAQRFSVETFQTNMKRLVEKLYG